MLAYLEENFWISVLILNYIIAVGTAIFIVLHNRNPTKTLSFILGLLLLPFIGIFIYYFFGQEYRKSKIFKREDVYSHKRIKDWERKFLFAEGMVQEIKDPLVAKKFKLINLLQHNQKAAITFKNNVQILQNAENKFKSLFEDLRNAKKHIHLEYYIFNDDIIGSELLEILCEKSREGVSVKVIYDYVGSEMSSRGIKKMKAAGVIVHAFMPVWFPNLTRRLNYRDHRKMVIIDGLIGYVGGVNICDLYVNRSDSEVYWRDTHSRIEGHAVKSLQTQFLYNWNFLTDSKAEIIEEYFPKVEIEENVAVQIAASGPDTDYPNIMEAVLTAITTAEKYIYITTPYFIPNDEILTALCIASRSGIDVRLIIPLEGDSWAAKYATNSYIEEMLESGLQVHHYYKGMVHAKTMVVDGVFSTVGTCNMDNRSFELNFEINALFYNKKISDELTATFMDDLKDCTPNILEEWRGRSSLEKVKESFCRLWAPLL